MLSEMTAMQLAEWMRLYETDPWGEHRADLRSAIVATTLANIHRGRDAPAFKPIDFMPYMDRRVYASDAEIERNIETFMLRYRGR